MPISRGSELETSVTSGMLETSEEGIGQEEVARGGQEDAAPSSPGKVEIGLVDNHESENAAINAREVAFSLQDTYPLAGVNS